MSEKIPVVIDGKRVGKLKASWLLLKESWRFLKSDREMLAIPVITTLISLALLGVLIAVFVLSGGLASLSESETLNSAELIFLFGLYVIGAFTLALAQAAIANTVYVRVHGGDATLGQSLSFAFSHWFSLLVWSVITSTVGVLLRAVSDRSQLLGKIVAALLGGAWAVLTYFVVPAMVLEKQSPFASIQKSASVFKRTWGEALVSNISLSLAFLIAHLLLFLSAFGLGFLAVGSQSFVFVIVILVTYIFGLVLLVLIQSVLESVLRTLLFIYAGEGTVPPNFNRELLEKMLSRSGTAGPMSPSATFSS